MEGIDAAINMNEYTKIESETRDIRLAENNCVLKRTMT